MKKSLGSNASLGEAQREAGSDKDGGPPVQRSLWERGKNLAMGFRARKKNKYHLG
jgi:hypothetical protein